MADLEGMTTAYNVTKSYAELTGEEVWKKRQDFLKDNFIDKNSSVYFSIKKKQMSDSS